MLIRNVTGNEEGEGTALLTFYINKCNRTMHLHTPPEQPNE